MVLAVVAVDPGELAELAADADLLEERVAGPDAWDANKMWWAALDLLLGPDGLQRLPATPLTSDDGYTPVMQVAGAELAGLAEAIGRPSLDELRQRFDDDRFGDPMSPPVEPEDREWLCERSFELAELVDQAHTGGQVLLWMIG